jgi:hypothetical protein
VFDSFTREQLRQAYVEAWRKHLSNAPPSPLEATIIAVIVAHPEYQFMLGEAGVAEFDAAAAGDAGNPFLHMGLHLAVRDQIATDRPPGIREIHGRLHARFGDLHRAEHALMEALGETLWEGQRSGRPPDEARFLERARRLLQR